MGIAKKPPSPVFLCMPHWECMHFKILRLRRFYFVFPFRRIADFRKSKKIQKKKRGVKQGSKKGRKGARVGKKEVYVIKVRSLRYRLKIAKDRKEITNKEFWALYKKIGGNTVRNIAHLRTLIDETISKRKG